MTSVKSVPAALVGDARRLGALKTDVWTAVRSPDGTAVLAAGRALDEALEAFRVRWCPKAPEVFVVCDRTISQPLSVFRRTPKGRAVLVYGEDQ